MVWWFVPRIIIAYYAVFGGQCPCEACPFVRGDGIGERGEEGETGGGEGGEIVVRLQYM